MERILSRCRVLCVMLLLTICQDVDSLKEDDIPHTASENGQHASQKIEKRSIAYKEDAWKGKRLNPYAFYGSRGKRRSLDMFDIHRPGVIGDRFFDGGAGEKNEYDIVKFVREYTPNGPRQISAAELKRDPEIANSIRRYIGARQPLDSLSYPFIGNGLAGVDLKRVPDYLKRDVHVPDINAFFGSRGKRLSFGSNWGNRDALQSGMMEKRQGEQYVSLMELANYLQHEKAMRKKVVPMGFYGVRGKRISQNISDGYRLFLMHSIHNMLQEQGQLPEKMPRFNAVHFKRQPPPLQYYANRG